MCVYSGVLPSALTQDNMCESLPIAHLSLFIATPHSESTQPKGRQDRKEETEGERGERDGEGIGKGIEGRERGGSWKRER